MIKLPAQIQIAEDARAAIKNRDFIVFL